MTSVNDQIAAAQISRNQYGERSASSEDKATADSSESDSVEESNESNVADFNISGEVKDTSKKRNVSYVDENSSDDSESDDAHSVDNLPSDSVDQWANQSDADHLREDANTDNKPNLDDFTTSQSVVEEGPVEESDENSMKKRLRTRPPPKKSKKVAIKLPAVVSQEEAVSTDMLPPTSTSNTTNSADSGSKILEASEIATNNTENHPARVGARKKSSDKPSRKVTWTDKMLKRLKEGVRLHEHQGWAKVAKYVGHKVSPMQCVAKWMARHKPTAAASTGITRKRWSNTEIQRLEELTVQHVIPAVWSELAQSMLQPSVDWFQVALALDRTPQSCQVKHLKLKKEAQSKEEGSVDGMSVDNAVNLTEET